MMNRQMATQSKLLVFYTSYGFSPEVSQQMMRPHAALETGVVQTG